MEITVRGLSRRVITHEILYCDLTGNISKPDFNKVKISVAKEAVGIDWTRKGLSLNGDYKLSAYLEKPEVLKLFYELYKEDNIEDILSDLMKLKFKKST